MSDQVLGKPALTASDVERKIQFTREADSPQTSAQLYDAWADTYDEDVVVLVGEHVAHNPPKITARRVAKFLPDVTSKLVEVCCGTGHMGQELASMGYEVIDGLDASPKMLEKAKSRNVYRNLITAVIGPKPTHVPTGSYDALAACACFLPGHLTGNCFPELARLVRIGGLVIIAYNKAYEVDAPTYAKDIDNAQSQLVKEGIWEEIYREDITEYFKTDKGGVEGVVKVFKIRSHRS